MPVNKRYKQLPGRLVLTDAERDVEPFQQLECLQPGEALVLRHYEWPRCDRRTLATELRAASKSGGIRFLVAGDCRLAYEVKADGLHLPSWMTNRERHWRAQTPPDWLVTAAAHNEAELKRAITMGADAALLSPVFSTGSHPGAKGLGVVRFAHLAQSASIPIYALGGVTSTSRQRLHSVPNLAGWATVSGFQ